MIVKNDYPILEYSTDKTAIINPGRHSLVFPRLCLVTFFREVLAGAVEKYGGTVVGTYISEGVPFVPV